MPVEIYYHLKQKNMWLLPKFVYMYSYQKTQWSLVRIHLILIVWTMTFFKIAQKVIKWVVVVVVFERQFGIDG